MIPKTEISKAYCSNCLARSRRAKYFENVGYLISELDCI